MKKLASERNRIYLEREKLSVGYLLAGFPEKEGFLPLLTGCEEAGLDIFEIGYPSRNPAADGEVIRNAHSLVDLTIQTDLGYWEKIRAAVNAPIWIMAYQEDLIDSGFYRLLAQRGLADAFVVPGIPLERRLELLEELRPYGVDVMGFVDPEMNPEEQEACFDAFPLVYQQLYAGPTGMSVETPDYEEILARAKKHADIKVFAGFGINTAERAEQLLESGFDGVIIGTAMMVKLNRSQEELTSFIEGLSAAVEKVRG
jgi:tryptophan synthase alpha chain